MKQPQQIDEAINSTLNPLGLFLFGYFEMEIEPYKGRSAVLIGNHILDGEHLMFDTLKVSSEFSDGKRDPMNRWTKRIVNEFAAKVRAKALYPFGDKVWPFQQFAKQASGMKPSPLGILIHPEFGLWHAFRAVLVFDGPIAQPSVSQFDHPCDSCESKPCLTACPVSAFSDTGLDVKACFSHLDSGMEPACTSLGCRARAACPVGVPYSDEQINFHMKSFRG